MRPTKDSGYRIYNVTQKGDCTYHVSVIDAEGEIRPACGAPKGVDTRVYRVERGEDYLNCGRCRRLLGL